jgi:hypothetical protein
MWTVWFYPLAQPRMLIDRFNTRSEAEAYRQSFARITGDPSRLTVCFES